MKKPVVLLLAGGIGKRFSPFVTTKTMFPFMGKPLICHILESLQKNGIEEVVVVVNHLNTKWINENHEKFKLNIKTVFQEKASGMGEAILLAEKEIRDKNLIVLGMHVIHDDFLKKFLEKTESEKYIIAAKKFPNYFPGGYLQVVNDRIISVVEKPKEDERSSNLVKLVFDYFSNPNEFINLVKNTVSEKDDQYERALDIFLKKENFSYLSYDDYYQKLTTPLNVLDMSKIFLEHKLKPKIASTAVISKQAIIEKDVLIDENVVINAFASIKAPAYIGKNTIIGEHVLIRSSIVEENSVIGFGTEIARSYIGARCKIHNSYVGDSVLESNINVSFGTCLANLRMDNENVLIEQNGVKIPSGRRKLGALIAKNVFIGANSTTLPGVMIGANSKIYPNTTVHHNVPENNILKSYQEQKLDF